MLIGIDFDNTIVCYDGVFYNAALDKGWIPKDTPTSKSAVRAYLRGQGREEAWIELQGLVYGSRMLDAAPFPGVMEFFRSTKEYGVGVCVISHRTRRPFAGPGYDLHKAAREWIAHYGFYEGTGLSSEQVFFELTRMAKLDRVRDAGCHWFIDDLPEFLGDDDFSRDIRKILFDPNDSFPDEDRFTRVLSWDEVKSMVAKEVGSN